MEPRTVTTDAATDDERTCAGCLQLMSPPRGVYATDDSGLAWHDPECVSLWAIREGLQ